MNVVPGRIRKAKEKSLGRKRTLRRFVEFRPVDETHVRFAWAAYKTGGLDELNLAEGLTPAEFQEAFADHVSQNYDAGWAFYAPSKEGYRPVGMVFVVFVRSLTFVGDMVWFPWASARNRLESTVHWFDQMRKQGGVTEYARAQDEAFFEMVAKHGVLRRVGLKYTIYDGEKAIEYETVRDR